MEILRTFLSKAAKNHRDEVQALYFGQDCHQTDNVLCLSNRTPIDGRTVDMALSTHFVFWSSNAHLNVHSYKCKTIYSSSVRTSKMS